MDDLLKKARARTTRSPTPATYSVWAVPANQHESPLAEMRSLARRRVTFETVIEELRKPEERLASFDTPVTAATLSTIFD